MNQAAKEQAFEKIYNESYDEMLKFMKGMFYWDRQEAYDVLQEVYLTAYEKIELLSDHENPIGWLKQTAKYKSYHVFERKNKINEILTDENLMELNKKFEDDYSGLLKTDLKNILTEDEYQLFYDFYIKGFSLNELAKFRESTDQAVKSKLARIRRKARKQLFILIMFG
ncbi:RNA polymerase sigma factor [Anaerostipes sp.]|uniref:RNA polymerase sigma factor n=1 Tax=Anaerostipes sp. TaxID=1872530 RepID=UPI0025C0FEE2|nr:sigma-70 family RNA polymerase sigma factor [Anaerostipes sp.]MBS7009519.1 sigma-70 family RNA polymerase sigma factor [Anaerostipes sp.]